MIQIVKGNLFDSNVEAYTNTINCVGIMGKGIALEFKKRYPKMFQEYVAACFDARITIGKMWIWENPNNNPKYIINFPTKCHWKNPSYYTWILDGLKDLRQIIIDKKIKSISIPALGCSNGRLKFDLVKELILEILANLDSEIYIYEP
jgi:O-acetyl-ADP-ribose deacetylase (regulator of RNase III)